MLVGRGESEMEDAEVEMALVELEARLYGGDDAERDVGGAFRGIEALAWDLAGAHDRGNSDGASALGGAHPDASFLYGALLASGLAPVPTPTGRRARELAKMIRQGGGGGGGGGGRRSRRGSKAVHGGLTGGGGQMADPEDVLEAARAFRTPAVLVRDDEGAFAALNDACEAGSVEATLALADRFRWNRGVFGAPPLWSRPGYAGEGAFWRERGWPEPPIPLNEAEGWCWAGLPLLVEAADAILDGKEAGGEETALPEPALRLRDAYADGGDTTLSGRLREHLQVPEGGLDSDEAVGLEASLARAGDPAANVAMGYRYLYARGVERDARRAMELFEVGARGGDPAGAFNAGFMLLEGLLPPRHEPDYAGARRHFEAAAEAGLAVAFNGLGVLHFQGVLEGEPDYAEAQRMFQLGADAGDPDSLYNLAYMAELGVLELDEEGRGGDHGVGREQGSPASPEDDPLLARAAQLYEEAVALDHWRAPYALAGLRATGRGVTRDCIKAYELLHMFVSEQGTWPRDAADAVATLAAGDAWAAAVRFALLAEQGFEVAISNLAHLLSVEAVGAAPALEDVLNRDGTRPSFASPDQPGRAVHIRGTHGGAVMPGVLQGRVFEPSSRSPDWDWGDDAGARRALAVRLWERAAAMGFAGAGVEVGDHFLRANDTPKALAAYEQASGTSAEGLWAVAQVHHYGLGGVPVDYPKAAGLYQRAIALDPATTLPSALSLTALYVSWGYEALMGWYPDLLPAGEAGQAHLATPARHLDVAVLVALALALLLSGLAAMRHLDDLVRPRPRHPPHGPGVGRT